MIQASKLQGKKCHIGGCEHGDDVHSQGICWKITKEHLKDLPTHEKYCPCKQDKELIRPFIATGYIQSSPDDSMIPKTCLGCGGEFLLRVDGEICTICENTKRYL